MRQKRECRACGEEMSRGHDFYPISSRCGEHYWQCFRCPRLVYETDAHLPAWTKKIEEKTNERTS